MELTTKIKRLTTKSLLIIFFCCILLWFSIFSYFTLYYIYIPSIAHIKPVHLKYDSRQEPCSSGKTCNFPCENITLVEPGRHELLHGGQAYAIELVLDMPESERNIKQGVFMVHLDLISKDGEVLQTSRRTAILRYKSTFFKYIYTLFFVPGLLAGTFEEKQSLSVPLFDKFLENSIKPSHYAFIEIESAVVEIYSCSLRIHAQFTGLRYMMYYWPFLSAIVGIGTNFFLLSTLAVFVWVRQVTTSDPCIVEDRLTDKEKDVLQEIRQSMQKEKTEEPTEIGCLLRRSASSDRTTPESTSRGTSRSGSLRREAEGSDDEEEEYHFTSRGRAELPLRKRITSS